MPEQSTPLSAPPPAEVPLPNAPLVRVIAQVRFPTILSVEKREFIAPFQEAIRGTYPILRQEQTQDVTVGSHGVTPGSRQVAWRFSDIEGGWRVSVAPWFAAIETASYTSRDDFIARLRFVLDVVREHLEPALVERLGVRYIDRVNGDALSCIRKLVRPEMLGILGTSVSEQVQHSVTETLFDVPGCKAQMLARWGRVPAGATVDRNAIEQIEEPSWVLDIDMFSHERQSFVPEEIATAVRRYAERIYTMFRWAVTDDFLREYGGVP